MTLGWIAIATLSFVIAFVIFIRVVEKRLCGVEGDLADLKKCLKFNPESILHHHQWQPLSREYHLGGNAWRTADIRKKSKEEPDFTHGDKNLPGEYGENGV